MHIFLFDRIFRFHSHDSYVIPYQKMVLRLAKTVSLCFRSYVVREGIDGTKIELIG